MGEGYKTARGERAHPSAPATRIRRPKELGRSGESPVPQPWSIIAEPVKVGDEWYVLARHPSGQLVHVRRFKIQSEAKFWIARKSKAWLKKQGYVDDYSSRQMKDSGLPASSKYRRDSVDRHQFDGEAGTTLPRPRDAWPVQRKTTKPPSAS